MRKKGETRPHPLTWALWLVTMGVYIALARHGDAGLGIYYNIFYFFCILTILALSIRQKLKGVNMEEWDKGELKGVVICLASVVLWAVFNVPIIAALVATGVDAYGFKLTIQKSYKNPWSESMWAWALSVPNVFFTTVAMEEYNVYTLLCPAVTLVLTMALIVVCLYRRRFVPKPELFLKTSLA